METPRPPKFHLPKGLILCFCFLIVFLFFLFLRWNPFPMYSISEEKGTVNYTENPWIFQQEGAETVKLELPHYLHLETGKKYTLSTRLTYDGSQDYDPYGYLHLDHMFCRISLEDQVIFTCLPEDDAKWEKLKSPGFIFKAFPLPHDCQGKEIKIELISYMTADMEHALPNLTFGDMTTVFREAYLREVPHNMITALCILLGVISILFSGLVLQSSHRREGIYVGLFSLVFSVYLITECRSNVYFIGNPYYIYLLNYISFSLLPVTLLAFMKERIQEKYRSVCNWVILGEILFFISELVLHFNGIWDFREFIPIIHGIYFAEIVMLVVFVCLMDEKNKKISLMLQVIPVLIGMIIDAVIYWFHLNIQGKDAVFAVLGVVFFLIIELLHIGKACVAMYGKSVRSALYRHMAYLDELTDVGNRRAYDREIQAIISGEKQYDMMLVISIDVNRLKYVNDTYGHAAGDCLIREGAHLMAEAVGKKGSVFRTGGDEFMVFLYNTEIFQYEKMMTEIQHKVEEFNREHDYEMSLAVGYERITERNILEAAKIADRKMYEDKVRQKMERKE